jgi:hypothetical protein
MDRTGLVARALRRAATRRHAGPHRRSAPDADARPQHPATAWVEAPDSLLTLGDDLPGRPVAEYKRRIGPWLLWRAGPAKGADARYWAARDDRLDESFTLRLFADGTADGLGPSGVRVDRFRAWKEDLRDA